jgi:probable DNA repair protein
LLNTTQEAQLWTQALAAVAEQGATLAQYANGVARAAALLREWRLPVPAAGGSDEAGVLAGALREFQRLCRERQVLSAALVGDDLLQSLAPQPLLFAGFAALTPRQQFVADAFRERGASVGIHQAADPIAPPRLCSADDWHGEARAAGQWAAGLLREDPSRRLLIISANRQLEQQNLYSLVAEELAPGASFSGARDAVRSMLAWEGGAPLAHNAMLRAALTLLTLGQDPLEFTDLSDLLLSPYQSLGDAGACAQLELWLRELRHTRFDWEALRIALRRAPAPLAPVAQQLTTTCEALSTQFAPRTGPTLRLSPRAWAQRVSEQLLAAGFPGPRSPDSRELQLLLRWQELLEEFASLDAVAGAMSWTQALTTLRQLGERIEHQAATGDVAVTLTARRDDPVVEYDGIWVMGLEEQLWPEPLRPDAFIPLAAQRQAGMPGASTARRLQEAREQLRAWSAAATSRLVLSYPRREADLAKRPSVLLQGPDWHCETLATATPPLLPPGQATDLLRDELLPPLFVPAEGLALRAGAKLPELQRTCPFRAQAELRLGAVALQAPSSGIDARDRGTLLHYALEELWKQLADSRGLQAKSPDALGDLIATALTAATARLLRRTVLAPELRSLQREADRNSRIIRALLDLEKSRSDFTVEAQEQQIDWAVDGATLRLRIDRLDRLPDGSLVVLDYKSGKSAVVDLLGERARPVQLFAYLAALDAAAGGAAPVAALAVLLLASDKVQFKGAADAGGRLPLSKRWKTDDWASGRVRWPQDATALVRQHLAGEARVDPLSDACRHCHLPGLCRIKSLAPVLAAALEETGADLEEAEDE